MTDLFGSSGIAVAGSSNRDNALVPVSVQDRMGLGGNKSVSDSILKKLNIFGSDSIAPSVLTDRLYFPAGIWIGASSYITKDDSGNIVFTDISGTKTLASLSGKEASLGNPSVSGYVLSSTTGGVRSWIPIVAPITPAALTKTDDTNVTLTLGGTPATSLLQAVSLTLGWSGTLGDNRIASATTWNAKQAGHANLTSLAGLSFVSASFVKMTGANAFALDTTVYCVNDDARLSNARSASDVYSWAKASVKPSYIYSEVGACAIDDARLSDSRNALDVYSWAKASVKPSYTYSEIGTLPTIPVLSDITKSDIEAKLVGDITTHYHTMGNIDGGEADSVYGGQVLINGGNA